MISGKIIADLRESKGWSQTNMANNWIKIGKYEKRRSADWPSTTDAPLDLSLFFGSGTLTLGWP